ncbi:MAG: carbohydrate-binding protein [Planctomycetota bacterium]
MALLDTLEPRTMLSATTVSTVAELTTALADTSITTINVAAGTYELTTGLKPQDGQSIIGAGEGQTIITGASSWDPGIAGFQDPGDDIRNNEGVIVFNADPYLFSFDDFTTDVTISNLTLTGPQLHGGIYGWNADDLTIHDVTFDDFLWSGVRTFFTENVEIYDNTFIDAGNKIGNTVGGSVYVTGFRDSLFYDNVLTVTDGDPNRAVMGFKARNISDVRIHNNTFDVKDTVDGKDDFSIEIPFDNDRNVEIDHNFIETDISIPRAGGGIETPGNFKIHHNYFNKSVAFEFPRNGVEIYNNLFDFEADDQGGHMFVSFEDATGEGPTDVYNNLIKNPGRGLVDFASYDNFTFRNNHVVADASEGEFGGRTSGLFGINAQNIQAFTIRTGNTRNFTIGNEQISVDDQANVTITDLSGNPIALSASQYVTVDSTGLVTIVDGLDTLEIVDGAFTDDMGNFVQQADGTRTVVTDFSTIVIKDNIFELNANDRPLSKSGGRAIYSAAVENNSFSGVSDASMFTNTQTSATQGLDSTASFDFRVGADESFQVENWTIYEAGTGQGTFAVSNPVIDRSTSTRIQAEDYDFGGEGPAYFDTSGPNIGGEYRNDEVDIRTTADAGGGYKVGWTKTGEYLEYTIDTKAGEYDINLRLSTGSSSTPDKDVEVFLDGVSLGTVSVVRDGWDTFSDNVLSNVTLTEGQDRVLRVEFLDGSTDFNWIEFTPTLPTVVLEAENFTSSSAVTEPPQGQVTESGFSQENLGFIRKNNWTEYSGFEFGTNSYSDVTIRFSSNLASNDGVLEIRTGSPTGTLVGTTTLGDTGGFKNYQEQSISLTTPLTGTQDIYLVFDKVGGGNPFLFNLDSLTFG